MRLRLIVPLFLAWSLFVTGAMTSGLVGAAAAPATAATSAAAVNPSQPRLIWGAYARTRGNENLQTALERLEKGAGRKVAATRDYLRWDSGFGPHQRWLVSTGRLPLISVTSKRENGTPVSWSSIANASSTSAVGKQIATWADRIKSLNGKVYFTFNHEPEAAASNSRGTSKDFVAAWRKIVNVFRQRGVTNAKYLWTMTGWAYAVNASDRRAASKWYPGDSYVDALGSDEYNDYTCRSDYKASWRSLASEIEPFRKFGLAHPSEELWLPEFGSVEDRAQPGRKAEWMGGVRETFKSDKYAQFRGLVYFSALREGTPCSWWADSSSSALSAFGAMGRDTFYTRKP
jgi:Glycosyl hydrolase family 26